MRCLLVSLWGVLGVKALFVPKFTPELNAGV